MRARNENVCIMCGASIPEGRMVCPACMDRYDPDAHKCKFPGGIVVKPDGVNELDPCSYVEVETVYPATVHVMRCKRCGKIEISWERGEADE